MPDSNPTYTVVAIYWANAPETPEFLAVEGKVVLFDTLTIGQESLPRLMAGRLHAWDATKEKLFALEFDPQGFNRLELWTGYDPYDVPGGFRSKGVYSEGKGRDWQSHAFWIHVLPGLLAWVDKMEGDRMEREQFTEAA